MGIFSNNRTVQEEPKALEYQGFFVEKTTETDIQIGEAEALEIPSFANALETIVSSISKLDVNLYQEDDKGKITRHIVDYRTKLLNEENHFYGNSIDYKRQIIKDMLIDGVSYSYLDKSGLDIVGIHRVNPKNVTIEQKFNNKGIPTSINVEIAHNEAKIKGNLEDLIVVPFRSEDGISGKSIFDKNQKILKLMYQELDYHENVYKNASVPFGVLETEGKASKDVVERLKATWSNLYKGAKNSGKIAVLENGLKYKPISQNPQDILLLDSRKANSREIEKIFNLPNGILEGSEKTQSMDLEVQLGYFKSKTLEPIIKMLESAFNKALLLEDEKEKGYYFKFDVKPLEVVKGSDNVDNLVKKVNNGIMTVNEVRAELDLKDFADSDNLVMSLGNVFKGIDGTLTVPNMDGGTNSKEGTREGLE